MGNVDDADPARPQVAHDREEQVLLLLGERGRGFVHDDDSGAGPEGAGDFDELLLGHRERADLGVRFDFCAEAAE